MVANGEKRAEVERDVRAVDLAADGELTDWRKGMGRLKNRELVACWDHWSALSMSHADTLRKMRKLLRRWIHKSGAARARAHLDTPDPRRVPTPGTQPLTPDPRPHPPRNLRSLARVGAADGRRDGGGAG